MDILETKNYKSDDSYISRYSPFPYYYNKEDNKFIYGLTSQLKTNKTYVKLNVTPEMTLDYLANKYYGRPDYWWVIADFNQIQDPFIVLFEHFNSINIPNIADIEFKEN